MLYNYGYSFMNQDNQKLWSRKQYLSLSEVIKKAGQKTDQYCSIFGYDTNDVSEVGNCQIIGPLVFDLDKENEIDMAYYEVKHLAKILSFWGLSDNDYNVSFSGFKGFHLVIPPSVLGIISPMNGVEEVYRLIAEHLAKEVSIKTIDFSMYQRNRLLRLINTRNSKSGLYKIAITGNESVEEILHKAKQPAAIKKLNPVENKFLSNLYIRMHKVQLHKVEHRVVHKNQKSYALYNKSIHPDVQALINSGVPLHDRNKVAFYIACYLWRLGFTEEEAFSYLETFANNCNPPYEDWSQLRTTIHSAFTSKARRNTYYA